MIVAAANFKLWFSAGHYRPLHASGNYLYRFKYLQHDVRTSWLSIYSIDCCKKPERKTKKKN